jgi:AmiR/NasT family two-component response regulator
MEDPQGARRLRVLIANQRHGKIDVVAGAVSALGHDVVPRHASLADVPAVTAAEQPDVALVIVDEGSERALTLIDEIVRGATCPVIAILDVQDRAFVREAAKRGIFAYIADDGGDLDQLQSSIDVALRRFAEYHGLEGAFGRRAITERAKGILMERHSIDEQEAFNRLRDQARRTNRKIVDVAEAIIQSHSLLPDRRDRSRSPADEEG